jgi:predicted transposase/invertase (TIGR01784 family)
MGADINERADRYLNPFTDFGFKKLFGIEPNKDLLIDFLNQLIKDEGKIVDIEYMNPEKLGNRKEDRRAIFDIYCKNEKGEKFIVEMQKAKINFFKDRSIYYSSFPIQEQGMRGEWDFNLKAVYTIGILDFIFESDKGNQEYYHHEVKLLNTKTKEVFFDKLTYIYIEMPKFTKTEEELENQFEKWLYILKNMPNLYDIPAKLQERIFKKVFRESEIANFSREDKAEYEKSLKIYRDLQGVVNTAKQDGHEEGRKEGIKEGRKEGIKQGELKKTNEMIKNALEKSFDASTIAELVGMKIEEVEEKIERIKRGEL